MSKERITILGVAVAFYLMGGWSQYLNDAAEHGLTTQPVLGYHYIIRGIQYRIDHPGSGRFLAEARDKGSKARVQYQPEDPAVAVLVGDPNYSLGLGIIGFGTLIALCRELIQRRRGRFRGDAVPIAWQGLFSALRKPR